MVRISKLQIRILAGHVCGFRGGAHFRRRISGGNGHGFLGLRVRNIVVTGADLRGYGCGFPKLRGRISGVKDTCFGGSRTDVRVSTSGSPGLRVPGADFRGYCSLSLPPAWRMKCGLAHFRNMMSRSECNYHLAHSLTLNRIPT